MRKRTMTSFALAGLLALGCAGITGCKKLSGYENYADADLYTVGMASFTSVEVKEVEIDWIGGSIEVEQSSTTELQILEENGSAEQAERMRYYLDGDVLKIKYCAPGCTVKKAQNKNLRVLLPVDTALDVDGVTATLTLGVLQTTELSVSSVSGNLSAERILSSGEVEMESVSGKIGVGELIAPSFTAETVSGDVTVSRISVDSLESETVSGRLSFGFEKAAAAELVTMSGHIEVSLLSGLGATVRYETATGVFTTEKQYVKTGMRYDVFGQENALNCSLEVDTFSGHLKIL